MKLHNLEDVVALLNEKREMQLCAFVRRGVRLVSFKQGAIVFEPKPDTPADLAPQLTRFLQDNTGETWLISLDGKAKGAPTLAEKKKIHEAQLRTEVEQSQQMQDILDAFPEAKILNIRMPNDNSGDHT